MSLEVAVFGNHINGLGPIGKNSIATLDQYLLDIDNDSIILVYNADCTIINGESDQYLSRFTEANCDILFSASAAFHYDDDVLRYYFWKYYPRSRGVFNYLDANAFIGKVGSIRKLLHQIKEEYPTHFSWHDLYTRFYVDYLLKAISSDLHIKLDREQNLFGNLDGRRSAYKWPLAGWMHEDLFLRAETESLEKIDKYFLQDRMWDVNINKEGYVPKKGNKNPLIWIASGGLDNKQRLEKRLDGSGLEGKGFDIYILSLKAYISSLVTFIFAWIINRGETRPFRIFRYSPNKNPEWNDTMEKFLSHLNKKEGFTFAHFNDGELTFIKKYLNEDHAETWFGRRQQKYTKTLGSQLTKALKLDQDRYYVGVPCSIHHPRLRKIANELVKGQTNVVPAMSLHHNLRFFPNIINHMKDRPTYFVKNEYQRLDVFEKLGVEIKDENQIIVPFKNSYLLFDELKERKFPDGAIVILICGMLAKIIIPEWFERNPKTTFIALGSSMDDFIQRTNTKFKLYPEVGLPLTCNIQPTKFFAFGWKKECEECWTMEEEFEV